MMHACVEAWSEDGAGRAVGRAAAESRAGGRAVAGARARVDGTRGGGGDSAGAVGGRLPGVASGDRTGARRLGPIGPKNLASRCSSRGIPGVVVWV
jgi:hypothetical protein